MHLAIVNNITNIVEDVVVPPVIPQDWVAPAGRTAIETAVGGIGDTWNGTLFSNPAAQVDAPPGDS